MTDTVPKEFNWVKARSECSMISVFRQLEYEAKANVDQRNSIEQGNRKLFVFEMGANMTPSFYITREDNSRAHVRLSLDQSRTRISVERDHKEVMSATLTLNNFGECKLKVRELELEHWQFLRMALESVFFD